MANYDALFDAAGQKYNVDPRLIKTAWTLESGGRPTAPDSSAGAQGPMQMLPATATAMGVRNPRDMPQAVDGAARYLAEGLDATGTPQGALAYYHGGPDRSQWGPKTAAYVAHGQATYQTVSVAGGQSMVQPQKQDDPDVAAGQAAFQALMGSATSQGAQAASHGHDSDVAAGEAAFQSLTAGADTTQQPAPSAPTGQTTAQGLARNVAAGATDAGANVINIASDPIGNLIGKPLATAMVAAHDFVAPMVGGQRYPDDVRNMLLGDQVAQPGNKLVGAIAGATGVDPNAVQANSPAERIARKVMGNALTAAAATPAAIVPAAAGAVAGDQAAEYVPDWAKPITELAGNIVGAGVAAPAAIVAGKGAGAAVNAVNRFGVGAADSTAATAPNRLVAAPDPQLSGPQPGMGGPQPGMGGPVTNSVGAAASSAEEATMTPAEVQANRSVAEKQRLQETQPIGVADRTAYVEGVQPNSAEIEQTVNTARELKALNIAHPELSQEAKEIADANNIARQDHFASDAGSDVDVMNAKAARAAQAEKNLEETWANKTDADAQPVMDLAAQLKASPDGRRPLVRGVIDSVTNELKNPDGSLITDTEQLYGVRKHIDDLMSKEAGAADPKNIRAMAQLQQLKDSLDKTIEAAAPGFRKYLQDYSDASKLIDTMEALQKIEPSLYSNGRMTFSKMQNAMRQIVQARAAPGINQFKSIPDATMQRLWALRDDLRRSASAQDLARASGSDTAQNAVDLGKLGVKLGGDAAMHVAANLVAPVAGSFVVQGAKNAFAPFMAARANRAAMQRGMQLLRPDTPLRNPLLDGP